ncbi:MAG: aminotransferase class V-fold PLP-dependent enzyme [Candidatus Pacebacteria bacterium]|nr:aminotransferase class V-fold PLP-dependent enzyme [Candidatus Paceibacterota bacterium]
MAVSREKTISSALSPNTEQDDLELIKQLIWHPRKIKLGASVNLLEETFSDFIKQDYCFAFNGGRTAFLAILQALGIKEGEEVLVQGLTCAVLVAPILHLKAKPVFVDIDETLNIDPIDLKDKITKKAKVIVVQHTFGWPGKIAEIKAIAKEHNLFLVEDCAHSLGSKYQGNYCGTFGDASFFSFGRDKVISSVFGGLASTNNASIALGIKKFQQKIKYPSFWWTFKQLLNPILTNNFILPFYSFHSLGKLALIFLQKTSILPRSVSEKEKQGKMPKQFIKKMPDKLAVLAKYQLAKLEKFNEHRKSIADFYIQALKGSNFILPFNRPLGEDSPNFMKFPILTSTNPKIILAKAQKANILLGDGWRETPVVPFDTNIEKMGYQWGSCPKAEKIAACLVNLPTHINISHEGAQKIVNFLKSSNGNSGNN